MTSPIENNGNTSRAQAPYQVDSLGRIQISSIKNKALFDYAQLANEDQNEFLEKQEIANFLTLAETELTDFIYTRGKSDRQYTVYDEIKDDEGNVTKKSFYLHSKINTADDDKQATYFYKDNKPVRCILTDERGISFDINLESGVYVKCCQDSGSNVPKKHKLSERMLLQTRRIGAEKPVPNNIATELIMRWFTKDWDWGW